MSEWIESQLSSFRSLDESSLSEWQIVEMALNEAATSDALVWYEQSVPMLQLLTLFVHVDSQWKQISTYQDDDEFGLSIDAVMSIPDESRRWPDVNGEPSIFRWRVADELPTGQLSNVLVQQNDRGNIETVEFQIQDRMIQLKPGEVYENDDNQFDVKFMDESVLVQVDGCSPIVT